MDRRRFLHASLLAGLAACAGQAPDRAAEPSTARATPTPGTPAPAPSAPSGHADAPPSPAPEPSPSATHEQPPPAGPAVLSVLCRESWGAQAPREGFVEHSIRQLTVHHSATVLGDNRHAPSRFRQHQRYHQRQGWPDIAYHLGVDRRGNVYDLRPSAYRGDTFTGYDPTGHLLVLAEGDFDREQPTDEQLEGVAHAFAWGAREFGAGPDTLTGHRDHAQTACPGDAMYRRIPELRARVAELAQAGIERRDRCGAEAAAHVAAVEAGRA